MFYKIGNDFTLYKDQILSLQHPINISSFIPLYSRSNVEKFIKLLLKNHKVDFGESKAIKCPLDAAFELDSSTLKADLLCLLLACGAQIKYCKSPKTFLCIATRLAIESRKYTTLERVI